MNLLIELLQVALGSRDRLSRQPSDSDWEYVFVKAKEQTIAGVLFDGIEKLDVSQRPSKNMLMSWYAYVERLERRNDKMNYFSRNVMMRFMQDGFRVLVLKGQGNAMMYDNPRRRHPGDIDLWLTVPGKTPREGRDDVVRYVLKYCPTSQVLYHHTVFDVLTKSDGIEIEPHYLPTWLCNPFRNAVLQKWFEKEVDRQFENRKIELPGDVGFIYVPTNDFNITFQLIHIYRHLFSDGIGLRQIIDYYYLLRQNEHNDMPDLLRRIGLSDFTAALMYVLGVVCDLDRKCMLCEPNEKDGVFLLEEIMRAGNFGLYDSRSVFGDDEGRIDRFVRRQKRLMKFLTFCPSEVFWSLYFTIWQRCWRIKKGYTTWSGR